MNELAFEVVHVPAGEVTALAGNVAAVYRPAFGEPPYRYGQTQVREFQQEVLARHVGREGFRLMVARVAGRVVGFAYGYTGQRGQWWNDVVARAMPEEVAREWLGGHFEFVELAVAPEFQRCGIGTALHDALLEGLPHPRACTGARAAAYSCAAYGSRAQTPRTSSWASTSPSAGSVDNPEEGCYSC